MPSVSARRNPTTLPSSTATSARCERATSSRNRPASETLPHQSFSASSRRAASSSRGRMSRISKAELPQRMLPQLVLLHLAARGHADRLEVADDAEVARHAEVGAAGLAPGDELCFLGTRAVLQRDIGGGHFTQTLIRAADDLRGLHCG